MVKKLTEKQRHQVIIIVFIYGAGVGNESDIIGAIHWPIVPVFERQYVTGLTQLVECMSGKGNRSIGGNLPQNRSVKHRTHMTWHGIEPGPRRWEADDKPPEVRHGTANVRCYCTL
jgi:hypothetical protein